MEERPQLLSSEPVFTGRVFAVRVDCLRYDDGATTRLDIVEHRGSFAIIATTALDELILVRQYRHAVGRALWEIPAGTAEHGEYPAAGAARELREETGYRAAGMRALGAAFVTPGFCTEVMHFFHATGLEAGVQSLDEDERIRVGAFTLEQAQTLAQRGEIADMKTLLALMWLPGLRGQFASLTVDI